MVHPDRAAAGPVRTYQFEHHRSGTVSTRVPVLVHADDPVSRSGVEAQLRGRPEVEVVSNGSSGRAKVAVVVVDDVDDAATRTVRSIIRNGTHRVVVVAGRLDDGSVLGVTEAGACGL